VSLPLKNFENWLTFGEVMGESLVSCFLRHSVYIEPIYRPSVGTCFGRDLVSSKTMLVASTVREHGPSTRLAYCTVCMESAAGAWWVVCVRLGLSVEQAAVRQGHPALPADGALVLQGD